MTKHRYWTELAVVQPDVTAKQPPARLPESFLCPWLRPAERGVVAELGLGMRKEEADRGRDGESFLPAAPAPPHWAVRAATALAILFKVADKMDNTDTQYNDKKNILPNRKTIQISQSCSKYPTWNQDPLNVYCDDAYCEVWRPLSSGWQHRPGRPLCYGPLLPRRHRQLGSRLRPSLDSRLLLLHLDLPRTPARNGHQVYFIGLVQMNWTR